MLQMQFLAALSKGDEIYSPKKDLAVDEIVDSRLNTLNKSGLIGFEGEYELPESGLVKIIVEFNGLPSLLKKSKNAKTIKKDERDHFNFENELNNLLSTTKNSRSINQVEITNHYYYSFNGIAMSVPVELLNQISLFDSVKAIYPNEVYHIDPSEYMTFSSEELGMKAERDFLNIDELHQQGITGKDVEIAIIDTGIDYNHPDFKGAFKTTSPTGNEADLLDGYFYGRNFVNYGPYDQSMGLEARAANDPMETTYDEWKETDQPEEMYGGSYFYTSHGTHVAGTVAARGDKRISAVGMAPESTIYSYRVLGPYGFGEVSWILAAIEQVVIDQPDIVNMSLGNMNNASLTIQTSAINRIMYAYPNIQFVIAAGNAGPSLYSIGEPGTASLATTVANGYVGLKDGILDIEVSDKSLQIYRFQDDWNTNLIKNDEYIEIDFDQLQIDDQGAYPIYMMPPSDSWSSIGMGSEHEFNQLTPEFKERIKGSILVVGRGNPFLDTLKQAKKHGVGMIILVNDLYQDFDQLKDYKGEVLDGLPFYVISHQQGQDLIEKLKAGVDHLVIKSSSDIQGKTLASSSSRGPVNDVYEIKPDLVAPGTSILSTVPYYMVDPTSVDYTYAYQRMNGTSMAAPHIAGISALLKDYSDQNGLNWSASQIKTRLMNSAQEMNDDYSVYEVGSGFVNPVRALYSNSLVSVLQSTEIFEDTLTFETKEIESKTGSISFGKMLTGEAKTYTKEITIKNESSDDKVYTLSSIFSKPDAFIQDLNEKNISIEFSENTFTLQPNETKNIVVNLVVPFETIGDDEGSYEGYVLVNDGIDDYRLPFALYLESNAPVLETYFLNQPVISGSTLNRQIVESSYGSLYYAFNKDYVAMEFVLSTADAPDVGLGMTQFYHYKSDFEMKHTPYYLNNIISNEYYPYIYEGDKIVGTEMSTKKLMDGAYYLNIIVYLRDSAEVYQIPFYINSFKPILEIDKYESEMNTLFYEEINGEITITGHLKDPMIEAYQNHLIRYDVYEEADGVSNEPSNQKNKLVYKIGEDYTSVNIDENGLFSFKVPSDTTELTVYGLNSFNPNQFSYGSSTPLLDSFIPRGGSFYQDGFAWYGTNMTEMTFNLDKNAPKMVVNTNDIVLEIGNEYQLTALFNQAAKLDQVNNWQSFDASIVEVSANGLVKANGVGQTEVVVESNNGLKQHIQVRVTYNIDSGVYLEPNDLISFGTYAHLVDFEIGDYAMIDEQSLKYQEEPTPIIFEVMGYEQNDQGIETTPTIMARDVIDVHRFSDMFGLYRNSLIQNYLNGEDFLKNFTKEELALIPDITVDHKMFHTSSIPVDQFSDVYPNQKFYLPWTAVIYPEDFFSDVPHVSLFWSALSQYNEDNSIIFDKAIEGTTEITNESGQKEEVYHSIKFNEQLKNNLVSGKSVDYMTRSLMNDSFITGFLEDGSLNYTGLSSNILHGFKPITKIDLNHVVNIQENNGIKQLVIVGDNYGVSIGTIEGITSNQKEIQVGNQLVLENISTTSDDPIHYKIVQEIDGIDRIIDTNELILDETGKLSFDTSQLQPGNYHVYTWLENHEGARITAGVIYGFDLMVLEEASLDLSDALRLIQYVDSLKMNEYTTESWQVMYKHYENLKLFIDSLGYQTKTQEQVNVLVQELEIAISKLVKKTTGELEVTDPDKPIPNENQTTPNDKKELPKTGITTQLFNGLIMIGLGILISCKKKD